MRKQYVKIDDRESLKGEQLGFFWQIFQNLKEIKTMFNMFSNNMLALRILIN